MSKTETFDPEKMNVILATDAGSTTSKARLFMKKEDGWRFVVAGEAPTTVESPFEDVTVGIQNAINEIEELIGWKILDGKRIIKSNSNPREGVDLYVSTSSAGGGLQMTVTGVFSIITAESAQRAALGAGAIVLDVISCDDGREFHENIQRIRSIRPDMILVAGGTDGGTQTHISELIELIVAADPKWRLGDAKLPIVYAGNKEVIPYAEKMLGEKFALSVVGNIRPTLDVEDVGPSRDAIHNLFMEHVMSHAPGYNKLKEWVDRDIMPTPYGEGKIIETLAEQYKINAMGVGLGGATTNVYSVFGGKFNRTVSANLGMSYSISNVLKEAGIDNIKRWLPFEIDESYLRDRMSNKMIRPTIIPQTLKDLMIEHAVAREALRLGLEHHKNLSRSLQGVRKGLDIGEALQTTRQQGLVDMMHVKYLVGTGGLLSHAPNRMQSKQILIDGFQPEGVTNIVCDSIFMMPHLGVLSEVLPEVALEILEKDCLIRLGECIAPKPVSLTTPKQGSIVAEVSIDMPDGTSIDEQLRFGELKKIQLVTGEKANIRISPRRGFDVGLGGGHALETVVEGGEGGITLDTRGRPIILPEGEEARINKLIEWFTSVNAYPREYLESLHEVSQ